MATLHIQPPLLWTAGFILPPVCTVVVAARFLTRRSQNANYGPDDWLSLPALVLIYSMAAVMLAGVGQKSLGYSTPVPAPGTALIAESFQQTVARKAFYAITPLQLVCLMFIKLSAMLFYRRVFRTSGKTAIDISIHIINALLAIWGIGFAFPWIFACGKHFEWAWTTVEDQLMCPVDFSMLDLSLSISDVIMDVIVLLFPIPLVLRLQMSAANKFAVLLVFALGAVAIAASITRLSIVVSDLSVEFAEHADEDYLSTDALYFMYIEACFGLCAVCLPSLSGALKLKGVQVMIKGFTSIFSSRSRSYKGEADRGYIKDSKPPSSTPSATQFYVTTTMTEAGRDIEMQPVSENGQGITVTSGVHQSST